MNRHWDIIALVAVFAGGALASACTLTNEKDEPVVLTAQTAPALILAQMKKGCPDLIVAGDAAVALAKAINVAESTQGAINTASNMASIACSLLVPPPAVAKAG